MPLKPDSEIIAEAKELIGQMEHGGKSQHQMLRELGKMNEQAEKMSDPDRYEAMRKVELAQAYMRVSDGKGGVDREAHKTAINAWENVKAGRAPYGPGHSPSHRFAASINRPDFMLEEPGKRYADHMRQQAALGGASAGPAAGFNTRSAPTERVGVVASHGPTRGFASVKMMALTAAVTAIAVPALRHLLPERVTEPAQVRTTQLERALDQLEERAEAGTPAASAPAVQRDKPGGP